MLKGTIRNLTILFVLSSSVSHAAPTVGEWVPIFKGVDELTASCSVNDPRMMKIYAIRIDTKAQGIQFTTTERSNPYKVDTSETRRIPTKLFLTSSKCQVAINADFFSPFVPAYQSSYTNLLHLSVSKGEVVSPATDGASVLITRDNKVSIMPTTPATSLNNVWTAVSGSGMVLTDGNAIEGDTALHPRSAAGVSKDGRYLYLMAVDGRQKGWSDGATTKEVGEWLARLGAYNGLNLDGGGSTTLVKMGYDGKPVVLNSPVGWADMNGVSLQGRERFNGNSLGVYAQPLHRK
ncbi:MAG: phosphodiester glycosidase family protein [Armatimonadota bacterium]